MHATALGAGVCAVDRSCMGVTAAWGKLPPQQKGEHVCVKKGAKAGGTGVGSTASTGHNKIKGRTTVATS